MAVLSVRYYDLWNTGLLLVSSSLFLSLTKNKALGTCRNNTTIVSEVKRTYFVIHVRQGHYRCYVRHVIICGRVDRNVNNRILLL